MTEPTPIEPPAPDETDPAPVTTSAIRRRWSASVFGMVAEGHARRRPSDIVRVVVATALVAIAAAGATDVTSVEAGFANLFASLPGGLEPVWDIVDGLARSSPACCCSSPSSTRRWRLLADPGRRHRRDAWLAGLRPCRAAVDVPAGAPSPSAAGQSDFPVAAARRRGAALLVVARPYLTRPAGRVVDSASSG